MCGIVGYIGQGDAVPFLKQGLRRLEHRGYDSAGMALLYRKKLQRYRSVGRVERLFEVLPAKLQGSLGIAHTRWATHGRVNQENTHPHLSNDGRLAVVHNGIIDNYQLLRQELQGKGFTFSSQSDSEVIPLLLQHYLQDGKALEEAFQQTLRRLQGTFGLVVLDVQQPELLLAARRGSPLLLALTEQAVLVASESLVFHGYSDQVALMHDDEIAILRRKNFALYDFALSPLMRATEQMQIEEADVERDGYQHFMLKEIEQQPSVMERVVAGRLLEESGNTQLSCLEDLGSKLFGIRRLILVGCGTSYHAALVGGYFFEQLARLPCSVRLASELSYANPIVAEGDLYIVLSQSGETADTLLATRELQQRGAKVLALCNRVGSSLARLCASGVYLHAGIEIAVASTKTFTAQMMALLLLAIRFARLRHLDILAGQRLVQAIQQLPEQLAATLEQKDAIKQVAQQLASAAGFMFIGRGISYPVALEGALKLKEIAYLPAEGLAGGEIKHGPLALVCANTPTLALLPSPSAA